MDTCVDDAFVVEGEEALGWAEICAYYEEAAEDYLTWSEAGNMHFGLWRDWCSPFNREGMLEGMTDGVADRLDLDCAESLEVLDLGCGIGAALRRLGSRYPQHNFRGITIVRGQVEEGALRNRRSGLNNVCCERRSYLGTGLPEASVDRAYAMESACYAPGEDKAQLINECARVMKPGGVLMIADPMLRPSARTDGVFGRALNRWCRDFAVSEIGRVDAVRDALVAAGFQGVTVTDVSWRVLPSLMHAPPLVLWHLAKERAKGPLSDWRKRHLMACFLSAVLGLHLGRLGYFMIRAVKI